MTESLRALLGGAIDYAGLFPPAALTLEQALAKYRQHRAGPEAWMLGRFVCPAGQLDEFAAANRRDDCQRMAVIMPGRDTGTTNFESLADALTLVGQSSAAYMVDALEFRWHAEMHRERGLARLAGLAEDATAHVELGRLRPLAMFFELAIVELHLSDMAWNELVEGCVAALAAHNVIQKSSNCQGGFKLRCGGTGARAIPSSAGVAAVICACRDSGVFWKATAGLHHPFRHTDPVLGVPMHGFINLLTATVMADVRRLDPERVQAILEDNDPWHFQFKNESLTWRELSATVPQISAARERGLRSFGSCSIDEPWQDLTVLGLL